MRLDQKPDRPYFKASGFPIPVKGLIFNAKKSGSLWETANHILFSPALSWIYIVGCYIDVPSVVVSAWAVSFGFLLRIQNSRIMNSTIRMAGKVTIFPRAVS